MRLLLIVALIFSSSISIFSQLNSKSKKALDSLQLVLDKSFKEKDSISICRTYYQMGKLYDRSGHIKESTEVILKALRIAEKHPDYKMTGSISNYLASNYSSEGKSKEAIELYNQAFAMFGTLKDTARMSAVLMNIGTEYVTLADYKNAIQTELKALELKEQSKDSSNIAYYYQSLAELFFSVKDFDKWEKYLFLAEELAENPKYADIYTHAEILNELGEYYRRKNNINKAIETYNSLYNLSLDADFQNGVSIALSNLVPIYTSKGDYKNAAKSANEALALNRKANHVSGIIYNLIQLGTFNRVLKKFDEAEIFLYEGLKLAKQYNSTENKVKALEELYLINKNLGKNVEALKFHEQYITERDSLLDVETKKQISEIETKYESERKEAQIALLSKENDLHITELFKQRILIAGIIITASLFAILGFLLYRQKKTRAELYTILAEHKMLRSQLNPHFIFNSLMAIQNYLLKNDAVKTADYLSEFATLMRMILASSRSDKISIQDEIKITELYLDLQRLRFNNKFEYSIHVDEKIDKASAYIPPMLIQPFIENAIEHGVRSLESGEGTISVKFEMLDSDLIILIEDNGPGISRIKNGENDEHVSYATQITRERISTIEKMLKQKIGMEISGLDNIGAQRGTQVKFNIPLKIVNPS